MGRFWIADRDQWKKRPKGLPYETCQLLTVPPVCEGVPISHPFSQLSAYYEKNRCSPGSSDEA